MEFKELEKEVGHELNRLTFSSSDIWHLETSITLILGYLREKEKENEQGSEEG